MAGKELREDAIDERGREVLHAVIRAYLASGEPVSSRTISKVERFHLSSASIRNIMADLEDFGFLTQPHTSAGRVPTDRGYRLFVDVLMSPRLPGVREQEVMEKRLGEVEPDQTPMLRTASLVLAQLTDQVAIVIAPSAQTTLIRSIHFLRVGEKRFLAVLVTDRNVVDHRLVLHDEDFQQAELDRLSRLLTEEFGGSTLREMHDAVILALTEERERWEAELAGLLPLAERALAREAEATETAVFVEGTSRMMSKPEFADVDKMQRIFRAFEDRARLAALLSGCLDGSGSRVVIGEENAWTREMDLSVVAATYGPAGRPSGNLAIVGPRRMDYSRLVPLVEYFGRHLGDKMTDRDTETSGEGTER